MSVIDNYATKKQLLFTTQDDRLWAMNSVYNRFIELANWQMDYTRAIGKCRDLHFEDKKILSFWMEHTIS